jgi:hypothetical protein
MQLPISAIVVGYNEADLLRRSLPKLSFCKEILYFDLGSKDDSRDLADTLGAQVILHEKVDSCEWVHVGYANKTKYEWVLITDPDEILSDELITDIATLFHGDLLDEKVGAVTAPWIFYFKGKQLNGTNWGGIKSRILLVNNKRFEFLGLIHLGRRVLDTYKTYDIPYTGKNYIQHYWMVSYRSFLEKHLRYLRNEGEARYKTGKKTTIKEILKQPYRSFRYSYLASKGYNDGFTGLFLSLFWAWYESSALIRNYRYQLCMKYRSYSKN